MLFSQKSFLEKVQNNILFGTDSNQQDVQRGSVPCKKQDRNKEPLAFPYRKKRSDSQSDDKKSIGDIVQKKSGECDHQKQHLHKNLRNQLLHKQTAEVV